MFSAVMILQLEGENKLSLTTPLSLFFPVVPNAAKITISMLLNHRSGLHNFTSDSLYATYYLQPQTQQSMLARIIANPSDFEQGSKFAYSNTNYVLLDYIIEKRTGEKYADALSERITSRLGLKETYYGGKISAQAGEASSFHYDKAGCYCRKPMSVPGGVEAWCPALPTWLGSWTVFLTAS